MTEETSSINNSMKCVQSKKRRKLYKVPRYHGFLRKLSKLKLCIHSISKKSCYFPCVPPIMLLCPLSCHCRARLVNYLYTSFKFNNIDEREETHIRHSPLTDPTTEKEKLEKNSSFNFNAKLRPTTVQ